MTILENNLGPMRIMVSFDNKTGATEYWEYRPQKDITAWELSKIIEYLLITWNFSGVRNGREYMEEHGLLRHFTREEERIAKHGEILFRKIGE